MEDLRSRLQGVLNGLERHLGDGRKYMAGDAFTCKEAICLVSHPHPHPYAPSHALFLVLILPFAARIAQFGEGI